MKRLILLLTFVLPLSGCYISRIIDEPVSIRITVDTEPILFDCIDAKYIDKNNAYDYKDAYLRGLKEALQLNNITVIENEKDTPGYSLVISAITLRESSSKETVSDEKSPYNGQSFDVSSCSVTADMKLYKGNMDAYIDDFFASADKEEKLTNNRNLGDYVFGQNKDNSTYRYKELPDDIFLSLSQKCGDRSCARITNKIVKSRNKKQ